MAGILEINSPNATVSFVFSDSVDRVQNIIENCAAWLYLTQESTFSYFDINQHRIPFENLTAQQKVDIVNKSIVIGVTDLASNYKNHLSRLAQLEDNTIGLGE